MLTSNCLKAKCHHIIPNAVVKHEKKFNPEQKPVFLVSFSSGISVVSDGPGKMYASKNQL